jgi:hypothetical protein
MNKEIQRIMRNDTFYGFTRFFNFNSDKFKIKYMYMATLRKEFKKNMGYDLNIDNPRTFNEKIQWLKVHYHDPLMVICADKVAVRNHIARMIGIEHLVPVYGIWNHVNDIDIEGLPRQFVLKTSHASGQFIICKDKATLDWDDALHKLQRWQHKNYYYTTGEWVYKDIKPRLICEEFLEDNIADYKIQCFNGEPKMLYVCTDRSKELKVSHFDLDFNLLNITHKHKSHVDKMQKPQSFEKMLKIAKTLSAGFPYVRVDLYESKGKVYFGELTFTPANGMCPFEPQKWDFIMGDMLDLSKANKKYIV